MTGIFLGGDDQSAPRRAPLVTLAKDLLGDYLRLVRWVGGAVGGWVGGAVGGWVGGAVGGWVGGWQGCWGCEGALGWGWGGRHCIWLWGRCRRLLHRLLSKWFWSAAGRLP